MRFSPEITPETGFGDLSDEQKVDLGLGLGSMSTEQLAAQRLRLQAEAAAANAERRSIVMDPVHRRAKAASRHQ